MHVRDISQNSQKPWGGVCHSVCDILDIILRLLKSSNCFILQLQQKASDNFLTPDKILSSVFSFHKGESGK